MSIIPWIIAACWAVFVLYWIVSSFGVKRDIGRAPWWRLWLVRIGIATVVIGLLRWGIFSLGNNTRYLEIFTTTTTGVAAGIGAVFCILGIALAVWARAYLGRNWSPAPALKEEHELVTSGPYKLIRHPIYTGVILAALGSTMTSLAWIIMFFIISAMFIWRVHVEERLMIRQFPNQYPDYKKRTWALVPFIW